MTSASLSLIRPLIPLAPAEAVERHKYAPIHYGTYFTHLLMSTYPERRITKALLASEDNRTAVLAELSAIAMWKNEDEQPIV
jgi:hypothetical protein